MNIAGLGIDMVEVSRFKKFKNRNEAFLEKVFTEKELNYCFSFSDTAPHLAGSFAAKEAVVKATGGTVRILDVEIHHRKNGKPEVYAKNRLRRDILVSISHTEKIACAIAICQ